MFYIYAFYIITYTYDIWYMHYMHCMYVIQNLYGLFLDIMLYVYINPQVKYMSDSVRFGLCLCSARQFCYCLEKLQSAS